MFKMRTSYYCNAPTSLHYNFANTKYYRTDILLTFDEFNVFALLGSPVHVHRIDHYYLCIVNIGLFVRGELENTRVPSKSWPK